MTILVVDCEKQRLAQTAKLVREFFPNDVVQADHDPLMAGKYAFNNPVDIVFAAWSMKRMNGPQMAAFVRREHPDVRVFLTDCPKERAGGKPRNGEADMLLGGSLTEEMLHTIFSQQVG